MPLSLREYAQAASNKLKFDEQRLSTAAWVEIDKDSYLKYARRRVLKDISREGTDDES